MPLHEVTWFHPALMDATVRDVVEPVHRFMGAPRDSALDLHAEGENGLVIEGSKHWEYVYALQRCDLLSHAGARVLDAGCGRSAFAAYLATHCLRVHGIDVNFSNVATLHPHGVRTAVGDLHALPYRDDTFDHVFCISVLEHTADPLGCFDELWRVTRPGGTLTVTGDYAPCGLPPRTVAAGRVMDHALLRRLAGLDADLPDETPRLLEGLGYFSQMWPTVLPVYLRFAKDTPVPPYHAGRTSPRTSRPPAPRLDPHLRRHVARQCYRAARIYLSYDWIAEARELFVKAWQFDRACLLAPAWGCVTLLPRPLLRAARSARRAAACARTHP
jgi:SAM-dependent methyltransferase